MAPPMPVLPEVASITILSGVKRPDFSPSTIMDRAGRSLMEPPGFTYSILARIFTFGLGFKCFISTSGVLPMASKIEWGIKFSF